MAERHRLLPQEITRRPKFGASIAASWMDESEEFRRKAGELKQRLEALGLEGAGGNIEKLQQRLLRAVNDLKIAEDERKKLKDALIQLYETVISFKKAAVTTEPAALEAMEAAMRSSAQALGVTPSDTKDAAAICRGRQLDGGRVLATSLVFFSVVHTPRTGLASLLGCDVDDDEGLRHGRP